MSDRHRVIFSARASADLDEIADYIATTSPEAATKVVHAIVAAVNALSDLPNSFKQVGVSSEYGTPVRSRVIDPYIVYYRVVEQPPTVYVITVRHGARRRLRQFE